MENQINDCSTDNTDNIDLSTEPVQSAPEELSFPNSPTPRSVPLSTIIALLVGNAGAQFGWFFFGVGMIFLWGLVMPFLMPSANDSFSFEWASLWVTIFPLFGLFLIIYTIIFGIKTIGLLKNGTLVPAQFKSMQDIKSKIDDNQMVVSYKMTFTYTSSNGVVYEHVTNQVNPDPLIDQKLEPLLYNPNKPSSAVLLDSIVGEPRIDSLGNIVNKEPISAMQMLCCLIIPLLSILGHGYYVYINYIK